MTDSNLIAQLPLLGLAIGLTLWVATNLTVGVTNPTVEWINKYVAGR